MHGLKLRSEMSISSRHRGHSASSWSSFFSGMRLLKERMVEVATYGLVIAPVRVLNTSKDMGLGLRYRKTRMNDRCRQRVMRMESRCRHKKEICRGMRIFSSSTEWLCCRGTSTRSAQRGRVNGLLLSHDATVCPLYLITNSK